MITKKTKNKESGSLKRSRIKGVIFMKYETGRSDYCGRLFFIPESSWKIRKRRGFDIFNPYDAVLLYSEDCVENEKISGSFRLVGEDAVKIWNHKKKPIRCLMELQYD